jgi:hypothetical protein
LDSKWVLIFINMYQMTPWDDYHWYRQDSNGGWSSKHGWQKVGPQVDPDKDAAAGIPGLPGSSYPDFCARMCAPDHDGKPPVYNPVPWNDTKHVKTNNCYSYACDVLHPPGPDNRPQPGGKTFGPNFKCIDVIKAAEQDGFYLDYDVPRL